MWVFLSFHALALLGMCRCLHSLVASVSSVIPKVIFVFNFLHLKLFCEYFGYIVYVYCLCLVPWVSEENIMSPGARVSL